MDKLWFLEWEKFVQNKQYLLASQLFESDVLSFGTWMDIVKGLDNLEEKQWKKIWPTISNFTFLTETLIIQLSPDRLMANCVLIWDSLGYDEFGKQFKRPGRASITLKRDDINMSWRAIHTHLSLNRDIPQKSYGKKI